MAGRSRVTRSADLGGEFVGRGHAAGAGGPLRSGTVDAAEGWRDRERTGGFSRRGGGERGDVACRVLAAAAGAGSPGRGSAAAPGRGVGAARGPGSGRGAP